ncbi:hypothetical protein BS78_09G191000 [Paspalum vaginatum]|nr:hypothetical protein BS78_09G191000 [Paspalum vaginatum]
MGNCVCPASRHGGAGEGEPARAERGASCEERTAGVKVTVRISKRQLQKLMMAKAAAGSEERVAATVGEVLAEIVSASVAVDGGRRHRRSCWVPTLQSIPEAVVES